jgi:DNA replication protein DnaC
MNDDLAQLLECLKLRKMAEIYDSELQKSEKAGEPIGKFLARLLRVEWHHRQECSLAWRIKQAKLPEQWSLESFPFKRQPGVSQRQIRTLADLEFIGRAENIVFLGPTNVGKTGLATGLLLKAMQNGYRGIFISAQDLFDEMYASLADRSTRRLLDRLVRVDVLVIDEMGYLNLKPEQTNI